MTKRGWISALFIKGWHFDAARLWKKAYRDTFLDKPHLSVGKHLPQKYFQKAYVSPAQHFIHSQVWFLILSPFPCNTGAQQSAVSFECFRVLCYITATPGLTVIYLCFLHRLHLIQSVLDQSSWSQRLFCSRLRDLKQRGSHEKIIKTIILQSLQEKVATKVRLLSLLCISQST